MGVSRIKIENLRSVAFGSITANYTAIGDPFSHPITKINLFNGTDEILLFSDDGTNNKIILPGGAFILLDITLEGEESDYASKGDSWYVKRSGIPTSGSVYLTAFYSVARP